MITLESLNIDPKLEAIDPEACGCTECIVGEYLPLGQAEPKHIVAMVLGLLRNNTGWPDPRLVTTANFANRTWSLEDV